MLSQKRRRKTVLAVTNEESARPRSSEGFSTPISQECGIEVIDLRTPVTWKNNRSQTPANQENRLPGICDIVEDEPREGTLGKKRKISAGMGARNLDEGSKQTVAVEQRRRSARLLNRQWDKDCRASDSDSNGVHEGSSGSSQGKKKNTPTNEVEQNACSPRLDNSPPKKRDVKKKRKKKKRVSRRTVDPELDSEKENVEGETKEDGNCVIGGIDSNHSRKAHGNKIMPLLGGSSSQGWTKAQEIALHNAYFTIKPVPNFWKEIAKLVPGKSSNECFHRFYSAHPTPPVSQPRSRINGNKNESPIRSFASDMHTLLKSAASSGRKSGGAKQNLLHAHKTVRHILRKQRSNDKGYETDLFSAVETVDSSLQSLRLPTIDAPGTPECGIKYVEISMPGQTLSADHTKSLSRFSADSRMQVQQQLMSPEVLKQVKNPALHDKYIDQLHSREAARKKTWTQNAKLQSNHVEANLVKLPQTEMVYAAKAAVIAEAQGLLRQSQGNEKGNGIHIDYCRRDINDKETDEDAEEQEEETEDEGLI